MTDKDPKDMTASELLRWAANNDEYISPINGDSWTTYSGKLKSFVELESGDWPNDARLCDCLADKIDAELAQARKEAVNESKKPMWWFRSAIKRGEDWPEPRDGEKFRDYLHRCFLPRPRFEDGEPVQFGEEVELHYKSGGCDKGRFQEIKYNKGSVWILSFTGVDHAREYRYDSERDTIKRPAPEVLGADGLPIREGETVWDVYGSGPAEVYRIGPADDEDGPVVWDIEGNYTMPYLLTHERPVLGADGLPLKVGECVYGVGSRFKKFPIVSVHRAGDTINGITADSDFVMYEEGYDWAEDLTHTPPDTQQRIDDDATLSPREYYNAHIGHDVGLKDDEEVAVAMVRDLLRRQRELDKRTGGE